MVRYLSVNKSRECKSVRAPIYERIPRIQLKTQGTRTEGDRVQMNTHVNYHSNS